MKLLKQIAVVAALSSIASYASALTPIADKDLSAVSGRDGVSIAADLHVNIGSFVYTDTDKADPVTKLGGGGSVSFNNIAISGTIAATLDVIDNNQFKYDAATVLGVTGGTDLAKFSPVGDVVKIAIPNISANSLNMQVASITMGGAPAGTTAPSFGSFAMNDIKLQGTNVYIWAH